MNYQPNMFFLLTLFVTVGAAPLSINDTLVVDYGNGPRFDSCRVRFALCFEALAVYDFNAAYANPSLFLTMPEPDSCWEYVKWCKPRYQDFCSHGARLALNSDNPVYRMLLLHKDFNVHGCQAIMNYIQNACVNRLRRSGEGLTRWRFLCGQAPKAKFVVKN